MCERIDPISILGYKHAIVKLDNTSYVWHLPCSSDLAVVRLILESESSLKAISGLQLYLGGYLSAALNVSITFVRMILFANESSFGFYNDLNGDILAETRHP